jgi:hypothetical protein
MAKLSGIPFYQANGSNYSPGREQPIRYITIHHSAGWEQTLRYLWADPSRNGSSHFWVGNGHIEQYVDTNDTAWTNGNWRSNNESITIEVRGDWRGYYDQATLDNLEKLLQKLRTLYPNVGIEYHKDVSDKITLCPADLKDKGYAKKVWDKVTAWLNPAPKPPVQKITYTPITPKRIKLKVAANLWDFNFTDWSKAKAVKPYGQGSVIDVVAVATNALGGKYYMTAYSYNNGAVRATNGFNIKDCEDYVPAVTQPPTVELKWEAMLTPRKMRLLVDTFVTDLDTMKEVGEIIKAGTDIDLVDKKTVKPGVVYVRSKYSAGKDLNRGLLLDRFGEVPEAPEVPREPVPEPPIDVDPDTPGNGDQEVLTLLDKIWKAIQKIALKLGINL